MNILCIDTSVKGFSLAIAVNDHIVGHRSLYVPRKVEQSLMPSIEKLLKSQKWTMNNIDVVAVGIGPGSFTGLRIGVSLAKGLVFGSKRKLIGISSLDLLVQGMKKVKQSKALALLDAKRGMVYAALFTQHEHKWERRTKDELLSCEDIIPLMDQHTVATGDALNVHHADFMKTNAVLLNEKFYYPHARHMVPIVLERLKQKQVNDPFLLTPLYLYPENCMVHKK